MKSPLQFEGRTKGGQVLGVLNQKPDDLKWINNSTETVMGEISASYAYVKYIGLLFPGEIYAVLLSNPRYTYPNLHVPLDESIRYLATSTTPIHTCTNEAINILSIKCSLDSVTSPDISRTDYLTFLPPSKPSAYQIYKGLDQDGLYPNAVFNQALPVKTSFNKTKLIMFLTPTTHIFCNIKISLKCLGCFD